MPLVCVERPNRTRVRVFTEKDAIRIACRAIASGASPKAILEGVMRCEGTSEESLLDALITMVELIVGFLRRALPIVQLALRTLSAIVLFIPRLRFLSVIFLGIDRTIARLEQVIRDGEHLQVSGSNLLELVNSREEGN